MMRTDTGVGKRVYLVGMMPAHCSGGPALLGTCRSSHTRFLQEGCSPSAAAASTKRCAAALWQGNTRSSS